jgi:hypothetical protein
MDRRLLIIYDNEGWEWFEGTPNEAIKHVNADKRWCNYGRRGATIINPQILYTISLETVERHYIDEHTYIDDVNKLEDELRRGQGEIERQAIKTLRDLRFWIANLSVRNDDILARIDYVLGLAQDESA